MTISLFTVEVKFQNIVYDVEITPLVNGRPVAYNAARIEQWNSAEKAQRLFSKKIAQMLEGINAPADQTLTGGSEKGFKFTDNSTVAHHRPELWEQFVRCLHQPATAMAGKPKIDEVDASDVLEDRSIVGPGAIVRFTRNGHKTLYENLSPERQKEIRASLFAKKCYEHEYRRQSRPGVPIPVIDYTHEEEACLQTLIYPRRGQSKLTPSQEGPMLWNKLEEGPEKARWAVIAKAVEEKVQKEIAEAAKKLQPARIPAASSLFSFDE